MYLDIQPKAIHDISPETRST